MIEVLNAVSTKFAKSCDADFPHQGQNLSGIDKGNTVIL